MAGATALPCHRRAVKRALPTWPRHRALGAILMDFAARASRAPAGARHRSVAKGIAPVAVSVAIPFAANRPSALS